MAGRFTVESIFKAVDRVTAPVSRMQQRVGRFTRSMEGGLRSINRGVNATASAFMSLTGTVVKYGAVAGAALGATVGLLVREFSKIEDAEAAFTPLLGGAKRAKEMVQALNDTAASTPFQFENLASSASQLLPVMNGNIERTIKTMRMLGDTAGGNAQKLDSITRGFTKAMLKGKVDMESLNMIAEAGVPIFQDLAEVMGMQTGERFFKMISAGKVSTEDLTRAFEKLTGEGGKFENGMVIASKTTSGMFSTLKDNVALTAAELGGVLAPTVKGLIGQLTTVAQKAREWVTANRDLVNQKFLSFVDQVKAVLKAIPPALEWIKQNWETIKNVTLAVVGLTASLKILVGVLTLINLIMTANPLGLLIVGIAAAIAAITALWNWANEIGAVFDKMPFIFKVAFAPIYALVDAIRWLKNNVGSVVETAQTALGAASNFIGGVSDKVSGFFTGNEEDAATTRRQRLRPQVVSPAERTARQIEETRSTSSAEVTIRDETGRAEVTRGNLGAGIQLDKTGAF